MINNINNINTLTFGTKLMDANKLNFIPDQHVKNAMTERHITEKQIRESVRAGEAYWNGKIGNYVIYDSKDSKGISAKDIAVIVDKTKKWIITVMDVDPKRWFRDTTNPKDLVHLSRKDNPTILKNVEPED